MTVNCFSCIHLSRVLTFICQRNYNQFCSPRLHHHRILSLSGNLSILENSSGGFVEETLPSLRYVISSTPEKDGGFFQTIFPVGVRELSPISAKCLSTCSAYTFTEKSTSRNLLANVSLPNKVCCMYIYSTIYILIYGSIAVLLLTVCHRQIPTKIFICR